MITTESLVAPEGRLTIKLFPRDSEDEFQERLEAYVEEAISKTTSITDEAKAEEAQKAWAYYRAYDAVYERMITSPMEVDLDVGGKGAFDPKQFMAIERLKDGFLNQFNTIIANADEPTIVREAGTKAVATEVRWW